VLACRAFEVALAGIRLVTHHAGHAHVPATPGTWTPGNWLLGWGSGLRLGHQTPRLWNSINLGPAGAPSCSILLTWSCPLGRP
jgi:hypothetical protein